MNSNQKKPILSFREFVALAALMTSLTALSIDAMLPALAEIGHDLGTLRDNDNQLIISLLFLGMAVGQLIYGPVSDRTGRKPAIYAGFGLFILGSLVSLLATTFPMMLIGRVTQGLGAAGPRIVTVAVVRDQYEGRGMAQVMSFMMTVFILVPIIAPALGQGVLLVAHWRAIFAVFLGLALITIIWFGLRLPETLAPARRIPFSAGRVTQAVREIFANRIAIGYTITAGLVSGPFLGYLNSSQQIFQEQYGLGARFPLYFAILSLALGGASFANARLVIRYGMRRLASLALLGLSSLAIIFWVVAFVLAGQPPLWGLMVYLLATFFCVGILFGNLNAMAMEPLGHIAGVGAAVVGSLSTLISMLLGVVIGQSYDGTIIPLVSGFLILGLAASGMMRWAEQKKQVSLAG